MEPGQFDTPLPDTDVFRRLAARLDEMPVPFPDTQSGVEIRLLQTMFTVHEAEVALHLSAAAETASTIYRRMKRHLADSSVTVMPSDVAELQITLDALARKGSISSGLRVVKGHRTRTYGLAPLVVGMFEFQVNHLTPEYVNDFHQYLEEGFRSAVVGAKTAQLRTVPVHQAISGTRAVGTYADIRSYITESPGPFAVINCVCRQSAELLGERCASSSTVETCLTLGAAAANGIITGKARRLTREGVLEILARAETEGHVVQPQNAQEPMFICCCDRDCCEVLRNARKLPRPADAVATTHQAMVSPESCIGCGICVRRCPMNAISLADPTRVAGVNTDRCIGCGLCVTTCPRRAIELKPHGDAAPPPKTPTGMYLRMYRDRFGPFHLVKTAFRKVLGRKI